jgi:hypothetical protein
MQEMQFRGSVFKNGSRFYGFGLPFRETNARKGISLISFPKTGFRFSERDTSLPKRTPDGWNKRYYRAKSLTKHGTHLNFAGVTAFFSAIPGLLRNAYTK